jgi:hypothetical protein
MSRAAPVPSRGDDELAVAGMRGVSNICTA